MVKLPRLALLDPLRTVQRVEDRRYDQSRRSVQTLSHAPGKHLPDRRADSVGGRLPRAYGRPSTRGSGGAEQALRGHDAVWRQETMKAVIQSRYGGPEILQFQEVERPQVGDGEVLVRVHAASIHVGDWVLMTGKPYLMRMATGLRKPKNPIPAPTSPAPSRRSAPASSVSRSATRSSAGALARSPSTPSRARTSSSGSRRTSRSSRRPRSGCRRRRRFSCCVTTTSSPARRSSSTARPAASGRSRSRSPSRSARS